VHTFNEWQTRIQVFDAMVRWRSRDVTLIAIQPLGVSLRLGRDFTSADRDVRGAWRSSTRPRPENMAGSSSIGRRVRPGSNTDRRAIPLGDRRSRPPDVLTNLRIVRPSSCGRQPRCIGLRRYDIQLFMRTLAALFFKVRAIVRAKKTGGRE
jgi:hypothetical protein